MKIIRCCHSRNVCSSSGQAINIKEYWLLPSIRREICLLNICVGHKNPIRRDWNVLLSQFAFRRENPHSHIDQNQIWGTGRDFYICSSLDMMVWAHYRSAEAVTQARVPFSQHWLFFSSGSEWISDQSPAGFTQLDSRAPIPDMKEECSLTPVDETEELQPLPMLRVHQTRQKSWYDTIFGVVRWGGNLPLLKNSLTFTSCPAWKGLTLLMR